MHTKNFSFKNTEYKIKENKYIEFKKKDFI